MNLSEVGVGNSSFLTFHLWGCMRGGCQGIMISSPLHLLSNSWCFLSSSRACFGVKGKFGVCNAAQCPAHSMHVTECTRVILCISDVPFLRTSVVQIWHLVLASCFPKWRFLELLFLYLCINCFLSVDVEPKYDCIGRISPCISLAHGNICYDVR